MATVYKQFLFDGFLAPEKSWWYQWNNISGIDALYFYAAPKIGQNRAGRSSPWPFLLTTRRTAS